MDRRDWNGSKSGWEELGERNDCKVVQPTQTSTAPTYIYVQTIPTHSTVDEQYIRQVPEDFRPTIFVFVTVIVMT